MVPAIPSEARFKVVTLPLEQVTPDCPQIPVVTFVDHMDFCVVNPFQKEIKAAWSTVFVWAEVMEIRQERTKRHEERRMKVEGTK